MLAECTRHPHTPRGAMFFLMFLGLQLFFPFRKALTKAEENNEPKTVFLLFRIFAVREGGDDASDFNDGSSEKP